MSASTLKQKIGCWLYERWGTERVLRSTPANLDWLDLCNRHESVTRCADGLGRVCHWKDSSFLTACRVFPVLGGRLLEHVAKEHPFTLALPPGGSPVSVIVPIRGLDRERSLSFVVSALRAIVAPGSEVLVCEHDVTPLLGREWQEGVRHVFVPAAEGEAFNKSKALNAGALAARHPVLLLHDADVWPCADYVSSCMGLMENQGWEAIRPIRFLFLLDEDQTQQCLSTQEVGKGWVLPKVQQNNPGLSSFVRRDTYIEVGGHDERFRGWGWEDVEFLSRLQTRKFYPGSFLPAIHLWHAPPPAKLDKNWNRDLLQEILQEPINQRIERGRRQLEQAVPS